MTIEIHRAELEALIQQRMASGAFRDLDELLTKAIGALDAPPTPSPKVAANNLNELFEPVRGLLTDEEIDTLFRRDPSPGRPIDLS